MIINLQDLKDSLTDAKFQLTMLFIGGRTPSDDQMPRVEYLRDFIARIENQIRDAEISAMEK